MARAVKLLKPGAGVGNADAFDRRLVVSQAAAVVFDFQFES